MTKKVLIVFLSCIFTTFSLQANNEKREMRATWLTTVANIDWPTTTSASSQKAEMLKMLDSIASMNMNTVLFQIRPCCDALYKSAYEPWSSYLKNGRGKDPGYDPLQFVIDECHKRGMSCHGWINPYRYNKRGAGATDWSGADDSELNYTKTHPEWLLWYTNDIILDPAQPEVIQRIKDVIGDIINNYDVDGILMDDYFYPYGGTKNQDSASVRKYCPADKNVSDWRRENVNRMVKACYDTIQAVKPWVTFGVSPFGIWTIDSNVAKKEGITLPSGITGGNMYQEIYCDPVAWLKEGTIDYISPQLYWKIGGSQDYKTLSNWWGNLSNTYGKHFYSSMAVYRYETRSSSSNKDFTLTEMENQAKQNRVAVQDNAPGAVFYNTRAWVYDKSFRKAFLANEFIYPAIQPAINWKPAEEQPMVENLQLTGQELSWTHENDGDVRYAIYAVPTSARNRAGVFSIGDALVGISYTTSYTLPSKITAGTHKIGVAVLDRYNNEYSLRILGEDLDTPEAAVLTSPNEGDARKWPVTFRWNTVRKADSYVFQFAKDKDFQEIVCTHELTGTALNSATRKVMQQVEFGEYYWRVKVRKPNCNDVWSEPRRLVIGATDALENIGNNSSKQSGVYTLNGQYIGTEADNLPKGIYIVNNQKVIK